MTAFVDGCYDVQEGFVLSGRRAIEGDRSFRGTRAGACYGRERELSMLESLFDDCVLDTAAYAAVVKAPMGVGKSRLARALVEKIRTREENVTVFMARGEERHANTPFHTLSTIVESTQRQEDVVATFPALVRAACLSGPVVVVIDDMQWCDAQSTQVIDKVLSVLDNAPLFVLALIRAGVNETFPKLWGKRRTQELRLLDLPKSVARRMVQQTLGERARPETTEWMLEVSEGNAFMLEELIRTVGEGRGDTLPEALVIMTQSRLLALDTQSRRIVRAASLFEDSFTTESITRIIRDDESAERIAERLENLVTQGIVVKKPIEGREPHVIEYSFRHGLLREAARSMLGFATQPEWIRD